MKKQLFWLLIAFMLPATALWAQDSEEEEEEEKERMTLKERIYYSGGLDLQFGNATIIGLYPMVGYKFNEILSAGIGLTYQYAKYNGGTFVINGIPYTYATTEGQHSYGGKLFGRALTPIDVFLHVEWETTNYRIPSLNERIWFDAVLAGAGYRYSVGSKASMNFMLLYNLNRSSNEALYPSEFVPRIEFAINF